jgi:hypothetical protein
MEWHAYFMTEAQLEQEATGALQHAAWLSHGKSIETMGVKPLKFIDAWYLEVLGKFILDDFDENMLEYVKEWFVAYSIL